MYLSVVWPRCQEYFVRKANNKDNKGLAASTHLITKEAEGSKYTAAKKWKLPAVSKQYVLPGIATNKYVLIMKAVWLGSGLLCISALININCGLMNR